ncbi:hypothetical protein EK21DRAFT_86605 [Setomelanomma holmii]|uniref:Protein kinase domain-containing protein n=1 Tax=Setomelanomma holmii TaxID=210430 RepID=A0A9P4LQF4_9PLEO|nr:hypothetical protein EK21DRAFT_86605 [Setomelanomma holmii]
MALGKSVNAVSNGAPISGGTLIADTDMLAVAKGTSDSRRDSLNTPSDWSQGGKVSARLSNGSPMPHATKHPVPRIMITWFWEDSESQSARTNCYRILFSKSTNVRCQLTISITVPRTSKYWTTTKISKEPFSCGDTVFLVEPGSLPQTLQDHVYHLLSNKESDSMRENDHIALALQGVDDTLQIVSQQAAPAPFAGLLPSTTPKDGLGMTAWLEDLGCPLYSEADVQTLSCFQPPKHLLSSVHGVRVEEVMCTRDPPSANFIYSIQAFHHMKEVPGALQLKGVVLDQSRQFIRSYMLELPKTNCTLLLDHLSDSNDTAWEERATWARKLIEIVSQVHSKGYLVGTLQRRRLPVVVDASGDLHLTRVESTLSAHQITDPPEYCKLWTTCNKSTSDHDAPKLTPEFDVYQLGLMLWVIAQSWAEEVSAQTVRRRFHVFSKPPYMDTERGTFALPPLDAKIPEFYKDMVDACRRDDPSKRPSAMQLLDMMPTLSNTSHRTTGNGYIHQQLDIEFYRSCAPSTKECDTCGALLHGTSTSARLASKLASTVPNSIIFSLSL